MSDLFGTEELEKVERINELAKLIKKYQDSYYNGEGEISDFEFDKLWDELKSLDPNNQVLKKVGADSGTFKKAKHRMMMGSQEKAADPEEFLKWAENHAYNEYLVEYKLDGASLELQYDNGTLACAITRGDGTIGDDITANAKKMNGIPLELLDSNKNKVDFTGAIRGEVIMTHKVHDELYADKANCRNAANGLMKRKDGEGSENLKLIVYDALATDSDGNATQNPFNDEEEKINWLKNFGFNVVRLEIKKTPQEVIDFRAEVDADRKNLEYDIDGLVIKERKIDLDDASRARPDRQIAFKFNLEEATTILRSVEWSESGSTYTPVGIFDEVQLNGTTVQRASLANPSTMRKLGVKIGSKVVVVKRGEIIPKIVSVISDSDENTSDIEIPCKCSACGSDLVDEGTRLYCPNKACSKLKLHQLQKWIASADIRDFGDTLIRSLFSTKKVQAISDLYALTVEDLTPYFLNEETLEKKKESAGAKKVFDSIQNHKKMSLAVFVAGFDIEGIGETVIQKLVDAGYNTIEKLFNATKEDFAKVYGFAEITAEAVVQGLLDNKTEIQKLISENTIEITGSVDGKLVGKSFCFTGELKTMKRNDAEKLVKENGGTCKSSVTKDLSYLVTNDTSSGSSKNVKAAKYGVQIINEEDFLKLVK